MALVKRRVDIVDPVEIEYAEILTPYALQFVSKQLLLKSHVNFIGEVQSCFLVSSSAGSIKVTNINCECAFGLLFICLVGIFLLSMRSNVFPYSVEIW